MGGGAQVLGEEAEGGWEEAEQEQGIGLRGRGERGAGGAPTSLELRFQRSKDDHGPTGLRRGDPPHIPSVSPPHGWPFGGGSASPGLFYGLPVLSSFHALERSSTQGWG